MIRQIATGIGAVAALTTMALAVPAAAHASTGTLVINGQTYTDPSGCINGTTWPMIVQNNTNAPVFIYDGPDCAGQMITPVEPGGSTVSEFGGSVMAPS